MSERAETVILETARPVDAGAAGRAIGPLLGLGAQDAARRARYGAGIVAEAVAPALAAALVAALGAAGIGARRVAAEAVPALPRPRRAVRARIGGAALELGLGPLAPDRILPWDEIDLVLPFALEVPSRPPPGDEEPRRRGLGARRPRERRAAAPPLGAPDPELSPAATRLVESLARQPARLGIDVVAHGHVYRLWRDELDYGPETGLPPELKPHSLERFLALGSALCARAARAPDPPEAAALLETGLLEPALFSEPKELERYERWWLARRLGP